MIPVTKPYLPSKADYEKYLNGIWSRNWLTNNGPLVNELESNLKDYLDVDHLLFTSNGTIALQIAIKALGLKGEIITTPFSYVATTSSIVWEGCTPVFVDIDPYTLNIDVNLIEKAITDRTSGILVTHVYGNPCNIDRIQAIAETHQLKVIYDAAHCFGTQYKGQSIFNYGDVSTCSFHATKLFHTIEGGAVMTKTPKLIKEMSLMRNFGHTSAVSFGGVGINGKNSEFHAAMGLLILKEIGPILSRRKDQWEWYFQHFQGLDGITTIDIDKEAVQFNYSYFPLILENEEKLLETVNELNGHYIQPRRYFFPSLNQLNYVEAQTCPISEDISKRVLCIPLYHDLGKEEQDLVIRVVLRTLGY